MTLSLHPLQRIADPNLAPDERESLRCRLVKELQDASARDGKARVRGLLAGEKRPRGASPARAEERGRVQSFRGGDEAARELSIFYAEDAPIVADAVKETLEAEGWHVEVCARGDEALDRLQSGACFDVLILDFRLPGLDGLELVRRARDLPCRQRTPIIMLTASEVEMEARRAGVDAFLRKPRGVLSLAETITRLLAR
jgi:CheY-like chemotaxis protein